jgi:hypothetical protein
VAKPERSAKLAAINAMTELARAFKPLVGRINQPERLRSATTALFQSNALNLFLRSAPDFEVYAACLQTFQHTTLLDNACFELIEVQSLFWYVVQQASSLVLNVDRALEVGQLAAG